MYDQGAVRVVSLTGTGALVAGTSSPQPMPRGATSYQATVVTTSTGASAVVTGVAAVQVSNDNSNWLALGTLTSTGSGSGSDGFASVAPWAFARVVISTLTTGVAAVMNVLMGA